jgi:hypothetical protein
MNGLIQQIEGLRSSPDGHKFYEDSYEAGWKDACNNILDLIHGQAATDQHPDDAAVDRFAAAMKTKLARKRSQGRAGWQEASAEHLSELLLSHLEKGDPVDIGNFAMMLHQNGQRLTSPRTLQP